MADAATDYGMALQNEIRAHDLKLAKVNGELLIEFRRRVYVECLLDMALDLVRDVCTGKVTMVEAQGKCEEIKRKAKS